MDRIRGGSPQALRERNKRLVLERLLDAPDGLTRPELARLADLTVPAIASLVAGNGESVAAVLDESIPPHGSPRARGTGRRPVVLRIRGDIGYVVGLVLNHTDIQVVIADLFGNYDAECEGKPQRWDVEHDLHGAIEQAVASLWKQAQDRDIKPEQIAAISVAVAAPVHAFDGALPNERRGVLRVDLGARQASPWLNIDPLAALANHLAALPDGQRWSTIDLHIDNDANLGALAELKVGAARGKRNVMYVRLHDAGIGAGFVFNGQSYRGAGGVAGEFGHVVLDPDRRGKCRHCGRPCVEAVVGSLLGCSGNSCEPPLEQIVLAALDGDRDSVRAITKASAYLGRALASIATVLNLERILIGGPFPAQAYRLIIPPMQAELDKLAISPVARDYILALGALREEAVLRGAVWLALERTRVDYLIRRAEFAGAQDSLAGTSVALSHSAATAPHAGAPLPASRTRVRSTARRS